ncbi:uncharacterized protein PHACADRAFT_184504 [Phanerochaete carnosa HHB-10118-sp]|uniref:NYN domain-containing protein n=1 Tax=Phanerochaete carnosa (strain HHB-10118-sp) TaxID=650164 RepID=K5WZ05_PHACS|nr:uncharacterized protein PHACADRAFT_184504 [Phanerochaete carnosa HHB-10118-sp]EKM55732.1 hypothetical protein PHACADRAFT_184504 [Phanerochaete carnosa HHB-10118-sp]
MNSPHGRTQDIPLVPVAIFWDYENCSPHHSAGYAAIDNIRQIAHNYGAVKLFKAYLELSEQNSPRSIGLRSELQSCGVSLTDCPHNGRKDVADKMMIGAPCPSPGLVHHLTISVLVDMLTYAIDTPAPATIILISGDRDFVYAASILRFRRYHVVIIAPPSAHTCLKSGASELLDWDRDVLKKPSRDQHTRHVSADAASLGRGQWPDFDVGARGRAIQSSVSAVSNSAAHGSGRRHSFVARSSVKPTSMYPLCPGSAAPPEMLCVPMPHSSPSTPYPHVHALKPDAAAPFAREGTSRTIRVDSNVLQTELNNIASNSNTPISPGTTASAVFSEFEQTSPTLCEDCPDGTSSCKAVESPGIISPIGEEVCPGSAAASVQRSDTINVVSPIPCELSTIATTADSAPQLSVRPPTPIIPAPDTLTEVLDHRRELDSLAFLPLSDTQGRMCSPTIPTFATDAPAHIGTVSTNYLRPGPLCLSVVSLDSMPPVDPFQSLVDVLDSARRAGQTKMLRSHLAIQLTKRNERVYRDAGVTKFKEFAALAQQQGIIELGGSEGSAWIALLPPWYGRGRRLA